MSRPNDAEIVSRVLAFFNDAQSASEVVQRIYADPNFGVLDPRGITEPVAESILAARSRVPGGRYAAIHQIDAVPGVTARILHNILYSFWDVEQPADPVPLPPDSVTVTTAPGGNNISCVSWSPPVQYDGFELQRAEHDPSTGGQPDENAFVTISSPIHAFQYNDEVPSPGFYWYRVLTVLGNSTSAPSHAAMIRHFV